MQKPNSNKTIVSIKMQKSILDYPGALSANLCVKKLLDAISSNVIQNNAREKIIFAIYVTFN